VLLVCIADGSDKLPTLVIGTYTSAHSCKMLKYFAKNMMAIQIPT
jgi:hypothetical protein